MAPEEEVAPPSYEHLDRLATEISRDQGKFDRSIFEQEKKAAELRKRWKQIGPAEQDRLLQQFALLFPRSREDENPKECLRKILLLPHGEDVQRALRVRHGMYRTYQADPGEEIYPTTGWLGDYLDYARWNKVPLALHFWAGLSILGAAVRRNYFLDNNVSYVWMNQFIILTGPKGNGKSVAAATAGDVLYRMNRKLDDAKKEGRVHSARAFQVPTLSSDITPQDLVKQLAEWSSTPRHTALPPMADAIPEPGEAVAILISDELSNLAGRGTYGAQLMVPLLTELCFKSWYHKSTVSSGEQRIDRMAFSILGCTQPGWMRETIVSDAKEGGFIERVNFIHRPPSSRMHSWLKIPIVDPLKAETLADQLLPLAMKQGGPQLLQVTAKGQDFFDGWYEAEWKRGPRDATDSYKHSLDRRCIHIMRLASLLCISEGTDVPWVRTKDLQLAIKIIEAEDRYLPQFMAEANQTEEGRISQEILSWIAGQSGRVRKTDLNQWLGKKYKGMMKPKRDELVANLVDTKQLIAEQKGGMWYGIPGVEENQ